MSKDKKKKVKLFSLFGASISTRQAAYEIVERANPSHVLVLDFSDVTFISRSFAHELLKARKRSESKIELINVSPNIQKLFDIVNRGQTSSAKSKDKVKIAKASAALSDSTVNF